MKKSTALILGLALTFSTQAETSKSCFSYETALHGECLNLSNQDFSYSNQDKADWIGANLSGANLEGASLEMAFLSKANLTGANLKNVEAYAVKMYKTNLNKTDLRGADLRGCILVGADLSTAIVDDNTLFNGCSINSETKLPSSWGKFPLLVAVKKGILTIRE